MKKSGQNLSEYLLPLALVGIIGIVSLSSIAGNLNGMFTNMIGTAKKPISSPGNTNAPANSVSNPFPNLPGKLVTVDLGNGKSITLNIANPQAVAESTGGYGVTENSLAVIQQLIDQLKEQGEDPAKIAELEKLALAGQKIKDLQKQIEAKFPAEGFATAQARFDFLRDPANSIVVDGKTISLLMASYQLSPGILNTQESTVENDLRDYNHFSAYYNDNYGGKYDLNYRDTFNDGPVSLFLKQLSTVESSGILNNPALKQLVKEELSTQIYNAAIQTTQVPTRAQVGALVEITRNSSNDICSLSNTITCQDRAG